MSLKPNLKDIFKENLSLATNGCPSCKGVKVEGCAHPSHAIAERASRESSGKTIEDIAKMHDVPLEEIKAELAKGTAHEQAEHGLSDEEATKTTMDHLVDSPTYYMDLAACGLDEQITGLDEGLLGSLGNAAVGAVKGAADAITGKGNDKAQSQGQDPSQMDPAQYKKYQAAAAKVNKTIDKLTQELQKARQEKAQLAKKYNINPNA